LCWDVSFCGSSWRFCIWENEKKGERDVAAATAATHAQVVKMRKKSRKSKKNGTTDCAFGKTGVEYVN
jgi:hypothetical protein